MGSKWVGRLESVGSVRVGVGVGLELGWVRVGLELGLELG